jgi:hypothetical protein
VKDESLPSFGLQQIYKRDQPVSAYVSTTSGFYRKGHCAINLISMLNISMIFKNPPDETNL